MAIYPKWTCFSTSIVYDELISGARYLRRGANSMYVCMITYIVLLVVLGLSKEVWPRRIRECSPTGVLPRRCCTACAHLTLFCTCPPFRVASL